MNHQPFEEWLLNDKNLIPAEKRELDAHLRTCTHCTALAETGMALRSVPVVAPAAGFTVRFQQRLAVQKIAERRRKLWGMVVLVLSGVGLLGWLVTPFISAFYNSPVQWVTAAIGYFLFVITSMQAISEMMTVFFSILQNFIPPYVWMVLASALGGLGLLWTISIWRFSRTPQGVSA
jgi:hypothetical protein